MYCDGLGFSAFQIAIVSAASTLATILGAPLAVQIAFAYISARKLSVLLCVSSALGFAMLSSFNQFAVFTSIFFLAMLLKRGSDTLIDARAVRESASGTLRFEHVRLWGSVGYVVAGFLIGYLVDRHGSGVILLTGTGIAFCMAFTSGLVAPFLMDQPEKVGAKEKRSSNVASPQYGKSLAALLAANAFLWASHAALYVYFSIYLRELGWSNTLISVAWNIGVVAEILLFVFFPIVEKRFSLISILRLSCFCTVLRWLILSASDSQSLLLASQVLHAFSFGGCYLASTKLMFLVLPEHMKDRGQGYLVAFGQGFGSVVGRLIVGYLATLLSGYQQLNILFLGSALIATLATICTYWIQEPASDSS